MALNSTIAPRSAKESAREKLNSRCPEKCDSKLLLEAGAEKHKGHSKDIIKQHFNHVLLYEDCNEIKTLKESSEAFECGKPYHRLNFFRCEAFEFSQTTLQRFIESNPESTLSSEESCQVFSNTVKLFKEANNGVVLKTSQKVCFDDNFSCCQRRSFLAASSNPSKCVVKISKCVAKILKSVVKI